MILKYYLGQILATNQHTRMPHFHDAINEEIKLKACYYYRI